LFARIESVRAKQRLQQIAVSEYALLLQSPDAFKRGSRILNEMRESAVVRSLDPALREQLRTLLGITDAQLDEWALDDEAASLVIAHMPEAREVVPELYARAIELERLRWAEATARHAVSERMDDYGQS